MWLMLGLEDAKLLYCALYTVISYYCIDVGYFDCIFIYLGDRQEIRFFHHFCCLTLIRPGPVGSEGGWAVDQSTVLLEPLRDAFLPLQSPDGSGVESGEEGEVGVEVVVLAEPLHDLDELDDQSFALPGVLLLKNFRSKIFWNIKIFVTSLLPLRDRP